MTEFMKDIPTEIEEAARLDGAGELRMLWQVVLPLCKPALGVVGVFGFIMIWDQYLLPLIAAKDPTDYTVTVALSILRTDPEVGSGVVLAGAVIALDPQPDRLSAPPALAGHRHRRRGHQGLTAAPPHMMRET